MGVDGVFFLIFATIKDKGKLQLDNIFNYGKARNIEYEDSDFPKFFFVVKISVGTYCPL